MRQTLLAYLLLQANRTVSREAIEDALWDGDPPTTARAALNNQISHLRRALDAQGSAEIVTVSTGYILRVPEGELDFALFSRHSRAARQARETGDWGRVADETGAALELWRGMPLHGLPALAEREAPFVAQYRAARVQALEWQIEAQFRLGRYEGLTAHLSALVGEFPFNEVFHVQLMRCLELAGRRAEALDVFQSLRRAMADELGIEPGAEARAAQRRILDGESAAGMAAGTIAVAAEREPGPDSGSAPATPGRVPAQLPADTSAFTGRATELHAVASVLQAAASGDGRNVVVVVGMGGVGKTSLAVRAARAASIMFPDGQLYVDLHGFGNVPNREPHEVLAGLLAALSDGESGAGPVPLPEHTEDRAAMLRSVLADRRVLLLLDNARDASQVLPLLPGDGRCGVVITSRAAFIDLPSAEYVRLEPLEQPEQRALLAALCGAERVVRDPEGAARILAACAGLPLALRISAARLSARPAWSLSTLAGQLDGERGRLPALTAGHLAVRATFNASYAALRDGGRPEDREAARAFRVLGLWPGQVFTVESASALLERPVDVSFRILEDLADAHLLLTPEPLRYRFHDLLGEFAAELVVQEETEDQRDAARMRLMVWHVLAVEHAGLASTKVGSNPPLLAEPAPAPLPTFNDAEQALQWFVEELANIKDVIRSAARSTRPDFAWRLTAWLFSYAFRYWWTGEWEECLRIASRAAEEHGDLLGQAWMLRRLGVYHGLAFRNEEAIAAFHAALAIVDEIDDGEGRLALLMNLALAYSQLKRHDLAVSHAKASLRVYRELYGVEDLPILTVMGETLNSAGEHAEAETYLRRALVLLREQNIVYGVGATLNNLADTVRGLGRRDEAVSLIEEAVEIWIRCGHAAGLADAWAIKGRIHEYFGEQESARACIEQVIHVSKENGLPDSFLKQILSLVGDENRKAAGAAALVTADEG